MRIAPEIVARYWEAAAAEQLARDLERQGYAVTQQEKIGTHVADVVARRNGETIVYEVKSPPWEEREADDLVALREQAVAHLGARFQLLLVTPPHDVAAEVRGLRSLVFEELRRSLPPSVRALAPRVELFAITDLEVRSIHVNPPEIEVTGDAVVHVMLWWQEDDEHGKEVEGFPLAFTMRLGTDGKPLSFDRIEIDTAGWQP
jgi:hypothetical protein